MTDATGKHPGLADRIRRRILERARLLAALSQLRAVSDDPAVHIRHAAVMQAAGASGNLQMVFARIAARGELTLDDLANMQANGVDTARVINDIESRQWPSRKDSPQTRPASHA